MAGTSTHGTISPAPTPDPFLMFWFSASDEGSQAERPETDGQATSLTSDGQLLRTGILKARSILLPSVPDGGRAAHGGRVCPQEVWCVAIGDQPTLHSWEGLPSVPPDLQGVVFPASHRHLWREPSCPPPMGS